MHFWIQPHVSAQSWTFGLFQTNVTGNQARKNVTVTNAPMPTTDVTEHHTIVPTRYFKGGTSIDADTLDGYDSTYFAPATHNHDSHYVNASGDTMHGDLNLEYYSGMPSLNFLRDDSTLVSRTYASGVDTDWITELSLNGTDIDAQMVFKNDGTLLVNNHKVWHEGNDGDGSGLNADLWNGHEFEDGMVFKGEIPDAADLNDYREIGIYTQSQSAEAGTGTNYPAPVAGVLKVYANEDKSMVYQEYWAYGDQNAKYIRTWYDAQNTWYPWERILTDADGTGAEWGNIQGDITQQTDLMDRLNAKMNYFGDSGIDLDTITQTSILNLTSSTNVPGNDVDGSLYTTNNNNFISQIWQTDNEMWTRTGDGSSWKDWKQYGVMEFDGDALFITL
jgi:hypothetical protein